jgi:prophage maintenance system killer protein
VLFTADELAGALSDLKRALVDKKEASDLFGTERTRDSVAGIVGNVFQSFDGKDVYPTVEEKAAHILYFVVKNHPFTDGNKRSGAFAFVWFLRNAKLLDPARLTPEALTALTLLVAESRASEKHRVIGLVLLLLRK